MGVGGVPINKEFWLGKFSLGIGLIFLSFLVAQIAKATFFLYITDSTYRNGVPHTNVCTVRGNGRSAMQ